jgi:Putative zinc-finger
VTSCHVHASGDLELYFYHELASTEREAIERHVSSCAACRSALDELRTIGVALDSRPVVSAPASGDWSSFMTRLESAIVSERSSGRPRVIPFATRTRRPYIAYVAMAAMLALVTVGVAVALRSRQAPTTSAAPAAVQQAAVQPGVPSKDAAFAAMTEEHFERSKLVVLGLATKDPNRGNAADWAYERELASSLLDDTRLYRLAAEDRGLDSLAGVMKDLELVLLQTSLTDGKDPSSLPQLQRLIRRRDLIEKMDVVKTKGL